MTVASWLLVVLVTLIAWRVYSNNLIQATGEDWFVVFDVDAEIKTLTLWFCPIVAFHISGGMAIPIATKPSFTSKLKMSRPAMKVNYCFWSVSGSYGNWARDNALIDEDGTPEMLS